MADAFIAASKIAPPAWRQCREENAKKTGQNYLLKKKGRNPSESTPLPTNQRPAVTMSWTLSGAGPAYNLNENFA